METWVAYAEAKKRQEKLMKQFDVYHDIKCVRRYGSEYLLYIPSHTNAGSEDERGRFIFYDKLHLVCLESL